MQFKEEGGVWADWLVDTLKREMDFIGTPGEVYYFRAQATDNVNNLSAWVEVGPIAVKAVTKYYALGGQKVAMRQGEEVYFLHGDHLGSTSLTTDGAGAVVSEVRYHPYGEERWRNGEGVTDFGVTGQRSEKGFGLVDYNARYYSPVLGRFVSPDSIVPEPSSSSGFNRYRYARNNPLKYVDPSGHCEENGDESCWSEYEELKRVCPNCDAHRTAEGDIPLGELSEAKLDNLVQGLSGNYRPKPQATAQSILPDGTLSVGIGRTIDFPIELTGGVHLLHIDEDLNLAMGTFYGGFGGATALSSTSDGFVSVTNAENLGELQGRAVNAGPSVSEGLASGGVDWVFGPEGKNGRINGVNVYLSGGPDLQIPVPPVMFGAHGNVNYTTDFAVFTMRNAENGVEFCLLNGCSLLSFSD